MNAPATWNTDIRLAPHGRYVIKQRKEGVDTRVFVPERVILSTKCGKVVLSHYMPDAKRWLMLGEGEKPVAWQPWPEPYSPSDGDAFVAVKGSARLTNANSVEPSPSDIIPNSLPSPVYPQPQAADTPEDQSPCASGGPFTNDPVAAADVTGDYLREPMAAASGQIILEGDAPRGTDCQAGDASQGGNDASRPDTEFRTHAGLWHQLI